MSEHENSKMTEKYIYRVECSKCKKVIEREAHEGMGHGRLLSTDYEIYFQMLTRHKEDEPKEYGAYTKRTAEFCSPECMIEYCHDLKMEDFDLD